MLYIVEALRWGNTEDHTYVVGIWDTFDAAKKAADEHAEYRGGKYVCQVWQAKLNEVINSDWNSSILYQTVFT